MTHPVLHDCRVNLIGGGEAQGTATDVAAVFTPGEAAQNQMYLYNMTLPHGFFSAAPEGTSTHLGSVTSKLQTLWSSEVSHASMSCCVQIVAYMLCGSRLLALARPSGFQEVVDLTQQVVVTCSSAV